MTIPGLGKLTPVQIRMIELSGRLIMDFYPDLDERSFSDTERLWSMNRARTMLTRITNLDFGFNLAEWHNHLLSTGENFGYTHPYGFDQTKRIIEQCIVDPETLRLASLATEQNDKLGGFRDNPPTFELLHQQIRQMIGNLRGEFEQTDLQNYLDAVSAYNILVSITGIDCGMDAARWISALVDENAT